MGMEELIPVVVTGGVVKRFSESMLPAQQRRRSRKLKPAVKKARYPSGHRPF